MKMACFAAITRAVVVVGVVLAWARAERVGFTCQDSPVILPNTVPAPFAQLCSPAVVVGRDAMAWQWEGMRWRWQWEGM